MGLGGRSEGCLHGRQGGDPGRRPQGVRRLGKYTSFPLVGVGAVLGVVVYCADKAAVGHLSVGSWIAVARAVFRSWLLRWCTILRLYYVLGFMR